MGRHHAQVPAGPSRRQARRRAGQIRRHPGLLALILVISLPTLYGFGLLAHHLST